MLVVAKLGFIKTFGPGIAGAVLLAMAVAVTFIPAALAILGDRVFWPSRPGREVSPARGAEELEGRPLRSRVLRAASARPLNTALACVALLLAAASGLLHLRVGQTLIRGLPWGERDPSGVRAGFEGVRPRRPVADDDPGRVPGIVGRRTALLDLQRDIGELPGVALVVGPAQQPLDAQLGAVYSRTRNAVRYLIVFDADPLGAGAIRRLRVLRSRIDGLTASAGLPGARVSIAGDTALAEETVRLTGEDLRRVAPLTLLVVFGVLAIFLRALVAPLYLVASSVLALAASIGLTVFVFQDLLGYGELTYYVPFVASVLLVALGSDYNVFLAGRIWQEARTRPLREAVAVGGPRAASAITVAGLVLALSFAVLALVPVRPFRELAFLMSVGLVLDAFVVRSLLVPSLIALVGPRIAWPRRLAGSAGSASALPPVPAADAVPAQAPAGTTRATRATLAVIALGVALTVLARKEG